MPYKPKKPCSYPGCNKLTNNQFCEEHKKAADKAYNQYGRDKQSQSFYNSAAWKKLRSIKLCLDPLCEECYKKGILSKATIADHIVPRKQGGVPLDINNLQSLCQSCHSKKSVKEGSRWGKG
jgi:5-methylcytosine-specific restriction protein A